MWKLQQKILDTNIDKNIFVPETRKSFVDNIGEFGSGFGVFIENGLIAYGILKIPGEMEDNLGRDIGLPNHELQNVAHVETVLVHPDYWGNSLQSYLINEIESAAIKIKLTHILCTVSPENPFSLNNFLKMGYLIRANKLKYSGYSRYILHKKLICD